MTPQALQSAPVDLEATFSVREFDYIAALVYERSGIVLASHKKNMMFTRLVRRVRELRLPSFPAYCAYLKSAEGESEMGALINAMTTNLTRFFREEHHFDYLASTVIPYLVEEGNRAGTRRLRLWSAGCSSGEEPYSIAITVQRSLPQIRQWDARILATDLDTNMVQRGANGVYPEEAVSEIPAARRTGFFQPVPGKPSDLRAIDELRNLIAFKPLNLLGEWPMRGPFDAIFCRNVMIYFDGETKAKLISRLVGMLKPQGWLFVGHSETLLDHQNELTLVGRTIYRRRT
ncbi:CheR Methylase of chemotaxis methyl-accepting proteins [Rhabdaerophilaceae bacterium]